MRELGPETANGYARRLAEGFFDRYLSGDAILDIGYRDGNPNAQPVTEKAVGIELDFPGYDGKHLPFDTESQDAVFASHTLEHIPDFKNALTEWFRVLKIGGYMIIAVPHQYLYERKSFPPSRFNSDHKRFYTPRSLLAEVDESLPAGGYRIRSLRDVDEGFRYDLPPNEPPVGSYEIELVIEKIALPSYSEDLVGSKHAERLVELFASLLLDVARTAGGGTGKAALEERKLLSSLPIPPYCRLVSHFPENVDRSRIEAVLRSLVKTATFDEGFYLAKYPDIAAAVARGEIPSGRSHFIACGYFESRQGLKGITTFD